MCATRTATASRRLVGNEDGAYASGPLELLVIQASPFCNLACDYCYLPERDAKHRLAPETLRTLCEQLFSSRILGPRLTMVWHAGEPLALGVAYYREAFALVERLRPSGLDLHHDIQSNGTLIDDDWCRLIRDHAVHLGLSIDGPAFLHDAHRRHRNGRGSLADALRGLKTLQAHGIDCHVITVLTRDALDHPDALYDFYVEQGIEQVGFNIEEQEGAHRTSSLFALGDSHTIARRFRDFLDRFLERVAADCPTRLSLREADSLLGLLLSDAPLPVRNHQVTPGAIISADWRGRLSSFSPELLGMHHPGYGDFILADVQAPGPHGVHNAFDALLLKATTGALGREIADGVARCRTACAYFDLCGGGAPSNKLFEHGRFDTTETLFCRTSRQIVIDVMLGFLERRTPPPGPPP